MSLTLQSTFSPLLSRSTTRKRFFPSPNATPVFSPPVMPISRSRPTTKPVRLEKDAFGVERVAYEDDGWNTWEWKGHKINYIAYGESGPAVVLIHGFGASAYQWRYNIPALGKSHRVFAIDLIGFGNSDKPLIDYGGGKVFAEQISAFIETFVGPEGAYVARNSMGGFASFLAASEYPHIIKGVVGLNISGRFSDELEHTEENKPQEENIFSKLKNQFMKIFKLIAVFFTFFRLRSRIRDILMNVYHNNKNVDDDLVRSIVAPTTHPNAILVFLKIFAKKSSSKRAKLDSLLKNMDVSLLLLWGTKDPWMPTDRAQRIMELYHKAKMIPLEAGHCPHDECPDEVNRHLISWIQNKEI